jgi:hypothetical protein
VSSKEEEGDHVVEDRLSQVGPVEMLGATGRTIIGLAQSSHGPATFIHANLLDQTPWPADADWLVSGPKE